MVVQPTSFERLSLLRERSISLDTESTSVSKGTDSSVENALEEDFDTIEILKQKFGDGEDYILSLIHI